MYEICVCILSLYVHSHAYIVMYIYMYVCAYVLHGCFCMYECVCVRGSILSTVLNFEAWLDQ